MKPGLGSQDPRPTGRGEYMLNKIAFALLIASAICLLVQKVDDMAIHYMLAHVTTTLKIK